MHPVMHLFIIRKQKENPLSQPASSHQTPRVNRFSLHVFPKKPNWGKRQFLGALAKHPWEKWGLLSLSEGASSTPICNGPTSSCLYLSKQWTNSSPASLRCLWLHNLKQITGNRSLDLHHMPASKHQCEVTAGVGKTRGMFYN